MQTTPPNLPTAGSLWSSHAWEALRAVGFSQTYPPAYSFFEQGSPVTAVGVIEEGLVKLLRWEHRGEAVTVGIRFSGGALGVAAAILRAPHPVTAETLTRCRMLLIPVDHFLQLMTNEQVSSDLHNIHAHELFDCFAQIGGLGALSTRERLLRLIGEVVAAEHQAAASTGPLRVALPLRYAELARAIVTTRQHLSRVLKQLEDENLIRRDKGWLVIPDLTTFWAAIKMGRP